MHPFAVINADDYYGKSAFQDYLRSGFAAWRMMTSALIIHGKLRSVQDSDRQWPVARGVCSVDENRMLTDIVERTKIEKHGEQAEFTEDDGATWNPLPQGTEVSMNLWGFTPSIFRELKGRFSAFLDKNLPVNPLKCEYFLPFVVDEDVKRGNG